MKNSKFISLSKRHHGLVRNSLNQWQRAASIFWLLPLICLFVLSGTISAQAASIYTDKDDYAPGDSVIITATGFNASETVSVQVTHADGDPLDGLGHSPWDVVADGSGNFETYWIVPADDNVGEFLLLTADGSSSGLSASTIFRDANSVLTITSTLPDSLCAGEPVDICVLLEEKCGGGTFAPLPGRTIIFFFNEDDCGVNIAQMGLDSAVTDANGIACVTMTAPSINGNYSIRFKYSGESKPALSDPPNSSCDNTKRVTLSNANICESIVVSSLSSSCPTSNTAPEVSCPDNSTVFLCEAGQVCLSPFSATDADGNLASVTTSIGTLSGNIVCFTADTAGIYTVTLIATDSSGLADTCTSSVTFTLNSAPVSSSPSDTSMFVCDLSEICLSGFSASDADGNLATLNATGGTYSSGTVCFTPVVGANVITLIATDSCGATSSSTVTVTISLNSDPIATTPNDTSIFVCDLSEICLSGFSASDADGNLATITATGGTYSSGSVCFTPVVGANVITLIATDSCGATSSSTVTVTISLNSDPIATTPNDSSIFVCDLSEICLSGFSASDADGNLATITATGGTYSAGTVCFTPVEGANVITLTATDSCGATSSSTVTVTISLNSDPVATTPNDSSMFVCDLSEICLSGFSASDADGNLATITATGGTYSSGSVCFTPVVGANVITLTATDSCGATSSSTVTVTVSVNSAPVTSCPADSTIFQCSPAEICVGPFSATDADNDIASAVIDDNGLGGSFDGSIYCFTPTASGDYPLSYIVTDLCGNADTCITTISVTMNSAPSVTCPGDTTVTLTIADSVTVGIFACTDPDGGSLTTTTSLGSIDNGQVTFMPDDTSRSYTIVVTCTDDCGVSSSCTTVVTVMIDVPTPVIISRTHDVYLCEPGTVCIALPSVSDGVAPFTFTANGQAVTDSFCVTFAASSLTTVTLEVTDANGATDSVIDTINATVNRPPTVQCADNTTIVLCGPQEICIGPFSCIDPDGDNISTSSNIGTIMDGETVCFTPDTAGVYTIVYTCTDTCGLSASCTTTVTVIFNEFPVATSPSNSNLTVCDLGSICIPGFEATDPDDNISSVTLIGGTLSGNAACLIPVVGDNILTLIVVDSCGAADTSVTIVTFTLNDSSPVIQCATDTTLFVEESDFPFTVCVSGFSCSDSDGDIVSDSTNFGQLSGNTICIEVNAVGTYEIIYTCTDACGNVSSCVTLVNINPVQGPGIIIATNQNQNLGKFANISVILNPPPSSSQDNLRDDNTFSKATSNLDGNFGGYDFLITYDLSALQFYGATAGQFIDDCEWEYFTYRIGPFDGCSGCTGDMLRVVAVADLNDGPNHPTCLNPTSGSVSNELVSLSFLVSANQNLACSFVPIRFTWIDCGDNGLSDEFGDTLHISRKVFDPIGSSGLYTDITDINVPYPSLTGAPSDCGTGMFLGITPVRTLDFFNGGVELACTAGDGNRGDINVNGLANEVADAVMFTKFFVEGLSAFLDHVDESIAASDVNADGLTLTVADLVFLIRIVVGDAPAIPKYDPNNQLIADLSVSGNTLKIDRTSATIGAMLVVFDGEVQPSLGSDALDMELRYQFDGSQTKALIFSPEGNRLPTQGNVLELDGAMSVVSVELGSIDGEIIAARIGVVPESFELAQNYPNPFNPTTNISFALPQASEWKLEIFNTAGQLVTSWTGKSEAGLHNVEWDAGIYASGVYLYRLVASDFSETRKMVLLK